MNMTEKDAIANNRMIDELLRKVSKRKESLLIARHRLDVATLSLDTVQSADQREEVNAHIKLYQAEYDAAHEGMEAVRDEIRYGKAAA